MAKSKRGGARERSGRPKKADEEKALNRLKAALKLAYSKDATDEENIASLLSDFVKTPRGQQFFAEHLVGKAPNVLDIGNKKREPLKINVIKSNSKKPLKD